MLKKYLKFFLLVWLVIMVMLPQLVLAANPALGKLEKVGETEGPYAQASLLTLPSMIGVVVNIALSLVGMIFLVLMLYAGYNWMTARGEEEKVEKAKDTITRAIIGLIIVVGAYAIWAFIFNKLF